MKVDIKGLGVYGGKTTDAKSNIKLKLKFSYEERATLAELMIFPGQTISLHAKYNDVEEVFIGEFDFGGLNIDKDGQGTLTLSTEYESFDTKNEDYLFPLNDGTQKLITFKLTADIDTSDDDEAQAMNTEEAESENKEPFDEWAAVHGEVITPVDTADEWANIDGKELDKVVDW